MIDIYLALVKLGFNQDKINKLKAVTSGDAYDIGPKSNVIQHRLDACWEPGNFSLFVHMGEGTEDNWVEIKVNSAAALTQILLMLFPQLEGKEDSNG